MLILCFLFPRIYVFFRLWLRCMYAGYLLTSLDDIDLILEYFLAGLLSFSWPFVASYVYVFSIWAILSVLHLPN